MDDLFRQRYRRDERRLILPGPIDHAPAMLVQVFQQTTIPTSNGVFYACHPASVFGTETEGGSGTITVDTTQTVYVLVLGSKAPSAGDNLVARYIGNRWVAERFTKPSSGGTVTIPGCPCPYIPTTLYVSSNDPTLNRGLFQNDTLVYGPKPSWLTNQVGNDPGFYGTTLFQDPQGGPPYVYYLWCFGGYRLDRAIQTQPPYGPYHSTGLYGGIDSTRGCQYPVNGRANSCAGDAYPGWPPSPYTFYMSSGTLPGGFDPTQTVYVTDVQYYF